MPKRHEQKQATAGIRSRALQDVWAAWAEGRHADAWRACTLVAGTYKGLRKREYGVPPPARPTRAEVILTMGQSGADGGFAGTELELDAIGGRELPSLTPWDVNDEYFAKDLLVKYTEWLPKARRRKSTPPWGS